MAALVAAIGISHAHQGIGRHDLRPDVMCLCDCRRPEHHGDQRTTYNDEGCMCATQPMALLAERWNCALFLDHGGDHWFVNRLPGDQWDWSNADHLHEHHDFYDASLVIERHMRQTAKIPLNPFEPCRQDPA